MKQYILFILALFAIQSTSCKKEKESQPEQLKDLGALHVTFADGKGYFNPVVSTPYQETIVFEFPTHFPAESENVMDISKMMLSTLSPSTLEIVGQTSNIVDLTKGVDVIIHKGNGQTSKHFVKGVIKKSTEVGLLSFSLPAMNLEGYIKDDKINLITGGADLANLTPKVTVSTRATISPLPTVPQNFNMPVEYTVTAEDGVTTKKYTVKFASPNKVESGIRVGSMRKLWTKSLDELGINSTDFMTTSIAVSGGNLIINTREKSNKIINRFNGTAVGQMTMGAIVSEPFQNFFAAADQKGQLLISNLVTGVGQPLAIYKWKNSLDASPVKLITWPLDAAWQVGRKMSIAGDLSKDALIYLTATKSLNTVLRWVVKNGVVLSQTPEKLMFPGTTEWTFMADVAPLGHNITDPVVITGHPGNVSYWDIATNKVLGEMPAVNLNLQHNTATDLAEFNKVKYVSFGTVDDKVGEYYLFNVTQPTNLNLNPSSEQFKQALAFRTMNMVSNSNGNRTSDVALKVSDDGYKLHMYCLLTNGSVVAYEFDCIDFTTL